MKRYFITFRSVTFAQRGEKRLAEQGIRSALRRTPGWMEEQGCGYCLQLRAGDITKAAEILNGAGIPMRKVYRQRPDGNLEEVAL